MCRAGELGVAGLYNMLNNIFTLESLEGPRTVFGTSSAASCTGSAVAVLLDLDADLQLGWSRASF